MADYVSTERLKKFKELYDTAMSTTYYNKSEVEEWSAAAAKLGTKNAVESFELLDTTGTEALFNE